MNVTAFFFFFICHRNFERGSYKNKVKFRRYLVWRNYFEFIQSRIYIVELVGDHIVYLYLSLERERMWKITGMKEERGGPKEK